VAIKKFQRDVKPPYDGNGREVAGKWATAYQELKATPIGIWCKWDFDSGTKREAENCGSSVYEYCRKDNCESSGWRPQGCLRQNEDGTWYLTMQRLAIKTTNGQKPLI
jgi:hypothetical protein